jgi:2-polyprenyl-3-methyl-5-hydroxy-6-metoxy-1,4-benzoquinol methylase
LAKTVNFEPLNGNTSRQSESTDPRARYFGERITYSRQNNGIFMPNVAVAHRDDEYDSRGLCLLRVMQSQHFWYHGRHRLVLRALKQHLPGSFQTGNAFTAIDLGGGCGGWIACLRQHLPDRFAELAISDSSLRALELAGSLVGQNVVRYQTDLLRLGWRDRWDAAFLLDVLEHIPSDDEVLLQIRQALKPGGLLFVTTPALKCFWSYNDEIVHHLRRYTKRDFARLADATGLRLLRASYFMFFLSPLLWLSRLKRPNLANMEQSEIFAHQERTHRVPMAPVNALLKFIFGLETPLGLWLPFPWGTSILGVFQKPF